MEPLGIWKEFSHPPESALKPILGGRLKGKTDIQPQWRYEAMTTVFGPCGIGWKYEIIRLWNEPGHGNEVFAFAEIKLYIKIGRTGLAGTREEKDWSDAIPGIGGHMLIVNERNGVHNNDEAYKMAVTDALSVAMKVLGVAADIYAGRWDGSKYQNAVDPTKPPEDKTPPGNPAKPPETATEATQAPTPPKTPPKPKAGDKGHICAVLASVDRKEYKKNGKTAYLYEIMLGDGDTAITLDGDTALDLGGYVGKLISFDFTVSAKGKKMFTEFKAETKGE
jgi:hypothetical protein